MSKPLSQFNPLFHGNLWHQVAACPIARSDLGINIRATGAKFDQFRRFSMVISALNGVVAPGLPSPHRAIRIPIIRLLNKSTLIEMVQQVIGGISRRKITNTSTRRLLDPEAKKIV